MTLLHFSIKTINFPKIKQEKQVNVHSYKKEIKLLSIVIYFLIKWFPEPDV